MAIMTFRTAAVLLVSLCVCGMVLTAVSKGADVDFGAHIVEEAIDLNAAHNQEQSENLKDMESLLHWAIEHSDPEQLREKAEEVRKEEVVKDFLERKKRVKELSDIVSQQPTETQLMMGHIAVLSDNQASTSDKAAALAQLQILVEPIDNANDLKVLDGLGPLVSLLASDQTPQLQEGAAYVLGSAASNNDKLVEVLIKEYSNILQLLLQLAGSSHEGAATKAMYAVGVLVRSPVQEARSMFYQQQGLKRLQTLMGPSSETPLRVKTKVVNLITDLIEMAATGDDTSLDTWDNQIMSHFAAAALDMLGQAEELDVKERALMSMRVLLLRRGGAGRAALEEEGGERVLREALTELDLLVDHLGGFENSSTDAEDDVLSQDEDKRRYAAYVAHLCADVLHHLSIQHAEL